MPLPVRVLRDYNHGASWKGDESIPTAAFEPLRLALLSNRSAPFSQSTNRLVSGASALAAAIRGLETVGKR